GVERRAPRREEVVETAIGKRANLAAAAQPVADFALATRTTDRAAEVRVADRHVLADEAEIFADRTDGLGIRLAGLVRARGSATGSNPSQGVAERLHQARYTSRSRNLVVRSRNSNWTWPVGPLRCLATMMSATPFLSVSGLYFSSR